MKKPFERATEGCVIKVKVLGVIGDATSVHLERPKTEMLERFSNLTVPNN